MVWLRRTTHYLFIVVVAVNSTLLTINAGDYIFYTDWAWTSFVVFSISQSTMLVVGVYRCPGYSYVLCNYNDYIYMGCQRCMVCIGISIRFCRGSCLDTIGYVVGFGVLGNKKEQARGYINWWCVGRNVATTI